MNAISQERLALVYPPLAVKIQSIDTMAPELGLEVTQGLRTWEEQDALYAQGRTQPGAIVTDVRGGYSWHNFGFAADVVPFAGTSPDWNVSHPAWQRIVALGNSVGLFSGSLWRTFPDWPHLQLTGRFPDAPTDEVRSIYASGGMQAVWSAAFPAMVTDFSMGVDS